jgi:hypothetical protein
VDASIDSIIELLEQRSSPELRRELPALRQEITILRASSLDDHAHTSRVSGMLVAANQEEWAHS